MSDDMHKYPGNLKHHKVDKKEQRKLLSDMMQDDAKSGLYDALAKRKPLVSDEDINDPKLVIPLGAKMIRDIYEAARAKDEELISFILKKWKEELEGDGWETSENYEEAISAAGFKPSKQ